MTDTSQSLPHATARQGRIRRVYAGVVASYIHDISKRTASIRSSARGTGGWSPDFANPR
jgi:hypothetical protein